MKKSLIFVPFLATLAILSTCGNSRDDKHVLARIDGDRFTEADFSLYLSVLDDVRRGQVLNDPEQRRAEFENLLRARLHALGALKTPLAKSASLKRRLALTDQRVMTQYYFETYLGQHAGFTRAAIESHYEKNAARFTDDSGKVLPFSRAYSRVVDSLIVHDGGLDSFYVENRANYVIRQAAEVSLIRTATRKQADAALKALKGGKSFAEVAARYSNHASKDEDGSIGRVQAGSYRPDIAPAERLDSLLFSEQTRVRAGKNSGVIARDNDFVILRVDAHSPERTPGLDEVRDRVAADYVRRRKTPQGPRIIEGLKEKHEVRLVPRVKEPTEAEIRTYYEANTDQYRTPEAFELYHIEASTKAEVSAALKGVKDLAGFKERASRLSENELTGARGGLLGRVKRDFAFPYGVGMLPALFPVLDEASPGLLPEPVENPTTQKWHGFWLVRKIAPAVKSLERVRTLVAEDLRANTIATVTPEDTLAVIDASGKILRQDDVDFLRLEIPEGTRSRYTTDDLLDYLIIWEVVSSEVRALGLTVEHKLRAARIRNEDTYWGGVYRDSLLSKTWETSPALLEKTFKANREVFTSDAQARDWKPFARVIASWLQLTPRDLEIEYHVYPERYTRDETPIPFTEARPLLFANLKPVAQGRLETAVLESLKKRFKVRIEDRGLLEPSLEPISETYAKAQELHYERQLEPSLELYEKLREAYPKRAGLQDSISFGIAQIRIEQERYPQAMAEYRRVNYLHPDSPNNYKAMFMLGFIQAEHLRQDSAAVRSFEAMLKKYPDSDLSDDADWMIRNIRSGGALMPALDDGAGEGTDESTEE